ncbi:MAG: right-handed parallel beta-helix repeat-containing protein [Planctomycetota bacterium]
MSLLRYWLFSSLISCFCLETSSAATIFVDASYPGCPGSGTSADPFCSIQAAIDAASSGDLVLVRPGTYLERIDFKGKGIRVRGRDGAAQTILDGQRQGSVVRFVSGEGSTSVLEGFTIRGGLASLGGGILCTDGSSPLIQSNIIAQNEATQNGGGIHCVSSSPRILGNTISGNRAAIFGGGVSCYTNPSATLEDNDIRQNEASGGGGISALFADPMILSNAVAHNKAGAGGGMYLSLCSSVLTSNLVVRNESTLGGGISLLTPFPGFSSAPVLTNNTIAHNTGQGLQVSGYVYAQMLNSIVWGNTLGEILNYAVSPQTVNYCLVQGGYPGLNANLDPQFRNASQDDFRLSCSSPAVDAGAVPFVPMPLLDQEGRDLRTIGPVDVGSDEAGLDWELVGVPQVGGSIRLGARAPGSQGLYAAEVFLSLGDGSIGGGIPVPGSAGRRLSLEADALLSLWLNVSIGLRQVSLGSCAPAATTPSFPIPPATPVGLTVHFAGFSWNPLTSQVASVSETVSFTTQ